MTRRLGRPRAALAPALCSGALIGAAFVAAPTPARADAIYGCWSFEGERIEVTRTEVTTPSGAKPPAEIDRHGASYVAPAGERDAGERIVYRQLSEEMVARRVDRGASGAEAAEAVEYWRPCDSAPIS